jgi:hypothetical protein
MIPGTTSKISEETIASAATISPKKDLVRLTGTTAIATIRPPYTGFSGILMLVPTNAAGVATLTSGNISVAVTMPQNRVTVLVYSKTGNTWYPGAIS